MFTATLWVSTSSTTGNRLDPETGVLTTADGTGSTTGDVDPGNGCRSYEFTLKAASKEALGRSHSRERM
jgi:hypothetical protein